MNDDIMDLKFGSVKRFLLVIRQGIRYNGKEQEHQGKSGNTAKRSGGRLL